jgi:MFS family permease
MLCLVFGILQAGTNNVLLTVFLAIGIVLLLGFYVYIRAEERLLTLAGIGLLIGLVVALSSIVAFMPGLFLVRFGLGGMLTPSVNVVQPSFPEEQRGEISGLSRSVSNLGSSFGTAIAGTILVAAVARGNGALRPGDGLRGGVRADRPRGCAAASGERRGSTEGDVTARPVEPNVPPVCHGVRNATPCMTHAALPVWFAVAA